MKLDATKIRNIDCAKTFTENSYKINCIDFSPDGTSMITSSDDDSIVVYNLTAGVRDKGIQVNSKKYGVGLIRYAHNPTTAIHSSTKVDDSLRYLSLHDNKYLRYFPGHTKKVTCLCMSPQDDMFLSGSLDKSIRLWDLRSQNCQGLMQVNGRAIAAFDPEGLIFGAGINNEHIKLYDLRSFDKGPFMTFQVGKELDNAEWTGIEFSPDGKLIMLNTNSDYIKIVDAFHGDTKAVLRGHSNEKNEVMEATFTPDSQFVFCGSSDAHLHCWYAESGNIVSRTATEHESSMRITKFNPKYFLLATACSKLSLWLPNNTLEDE
ncbi:unnamed protein product [Auanema sp. JU1783]|nr:unnamed protein product [Auanema sp. JU1783]